MIKALIFDMDNTLLDFNKYKHASVDAGIDAMISAGLKLSKKEAKERLYAIYDKKGIEYQYIFDDFLASVEGKVDYRKLARAITAYRKTRTHQLVPYKNVTRTLRTIKEQGYKLAIVSDAPRLEGWLRLVAVGLDGFFDIVVTHDDTCKLKPCPEPFEMALRQLKVKPAEVLMMGDNAERDIKGGKAMGMKTCWAAYGATRPLNCRPDFIAHDVTDILKIIKKA
jgi:HAD superfamily hydrolase (TIGR02253 family)